MGQYKEWIRYAFVYGATLGVILAILSLFFGTVLAFVDPAFLMLGAVGFGLSLVFAFLSGFVSIFRFVIGRFLYGYIDSVKSEYWRAVTVAMLGTFVLFILSLVVAIFRLFLIGISGVPGMPNPLSVIIGPFVSLAFTAVVTLGWSLVIVWLWKAMGWKVPE